MKKSMHESTKVGMSFSKFKFKAIHTMELIKLLVKKDIKVRYKRSILGVAWTLLNPILTALLLWIIFLTVFHNQLSPSTNFSTYVLSGVLIVNYFVQGVNSSSEIIQTESKLLTKVKVSPEILVIASTTAHSVNFIVGIIPLIILSFAFDDGISLLIVIVPLFILVMQMLLTGIVFFLSILFVKFADAKSITFIIIGFLIYSTPVFYPIGILGGFSRVVVDLNPVTALMEQFRFFLLGIGHFSSLQIAYFSGMGLFLLIAGAKYFKHSWRKVACMM